MQKISPGSNPNTELVVSSEGGVNRQLFKSAVNIRTQHFGNEVYPRGVVEISNYCNLNCLYCGMRKDNLTINRYRLGHNEIVQIALSMEQHGIKSIMLQSGDDYTYPIASLVKTVHAIRKETDLRVILCLGERKRADLEAMLKAGANMYVLKLETPNPILFQKLRPSTTFERRLNQLKFMKKIGYQISSGFIVGLPEQTHHEIFEGLMLLKDLRVDAASVSPFIPNEGSPLKNEPFGSLELSLYFLAQMRIHLQGVYIPAVSAFSLLHKDGQALAMNAGANVITINFTPKTNAKQYLMYSEKRNPVSLERARELILSLGMTSSILQIN
ncbi:MAG: radical SAM protein [Bacteroidota bacterium]|nr:radical SAM protein [Bacteroidota bacterium]